MLFKLRLCSTSWVGIVDAVVESSLALKHTLLLRTLAKSPGSSLVVFLVLKKIYLKEYIFKKIYLKILWPTWLHMQPRTHANGEIARGEWD